MVPTNDSDLVVFPEFQLPRSLIYDSPKLVSVLNNYPIINLLILSKVIL